MRNFKVVIDGKEYEVGVEEIGVTESAPQVVKSQVAESAPVVKKAAVSGGKPVKAPMPGMIKELKVSEGATVKKGDVIVVLEAMKMQQELALQKKSWKPYQVARTLK